MRRRYGWIPDYNQTPIAATPLESLPKRVDLRGFAPVVYDQGRLATSTAQALACVIQMMQKKEHVQTWIPSRLFIDYNQRQRGKSVVPSKPYFNATLSELKLLTFRRRGILLAGDQGCMLSDGVASLMTDGICPESLWNPIHLTDVPPESVYAAASAHKAVFERLPRNLNVIKSYLVNGYPIVFGFAAYSSFENEKTVVSGIVNLPKSNEILIGGHAGVLLTYDDTYQRFMVRNSMGKSWGMSGNFTIPYSYLMNTNLSDDFWAIKSVS